MVLRNTKRLLAQHTKRSTSTGPPLHESLGMFHASLLLLLNTNVPMATNKKTHKIFSVERNLYNMHYLLGYEPQNIYHRSNACEMH